MAGPTTAILGVGELTENRLAGIDALLASVSSESRCTRRGRVWDLRVRQRPIHVRVEMTQDVLWDCGDDLASANLLPEDAPFRVVLSAGINDPVDYEVLRELASELSALLGAPASEPSK